MQEETKIEDDTTALSIQTLILQTLATMFRERNLALDKNPIWVHRIKEILFYDFSENLSLDYLSKTLDIHPVHLSRDFSKYFLRLGGFLRRLRGSNVVLARCRGAVSFGSTASQLPPDLSENLIERPDTGARTHVRKGTNNDYWCG